jgi:acetoin utilization deacetylase AcuC-like enzyme
MTSVYTLAPAPQHALRDHPESPQRLSQLNLSTLPGLEQIPCLPATESQVSRVHTPAYIQALQNACQTEAPAFIDSAPTYITPTSYEDALLAVGAGLMALRAILDGSAHNALAIPRPPGHHAEPNGAMGFCLFNNAAIAAQDALAHGVERVAVIDFDAHHGNGTQSALRHLPRAAFLSTHQRDIYPFSGRLEDADTPNLRGRLVNLPLPARTGDQGFEQILQAVIAPFVRGFQPGLLIISAGYDSHWRDPLALLGLTHAGFHLLSRGLVALADECCQGRILFLLEGGYDPFTVANGLQAAGAALTGHPHTPPKDVCPFAEPDVTALTEKARAWHGLNKKG